MLLLGTVLLPRNGSRIDIGCAIKYQTYQKLKNNSAMNLTGLRNQLYEKLDQANYLLFCSGTAIPIAGNRVQGLH